MTHFEFIAAITPIERKLDALYDRLREMEERLLEARAKRFAADIASGLWSRFFVVVAAVITAFILTNVFHTEWLPW